MHYYTVHYKFSQSFPFPVQAAYDWATDYDEEDLSLMGLQGKREIERVDGDTLVLYDTFFSDGRTTKKKRLVRLFPELLMLTNTRLAGPMKHSQFIYQFVAEGRTGSRARVHRGPGGEVGEETIPVEDSSAVEPVRKGGRGALGQPCEGDGEGPRRPMLTLYITKPRADE